MLAYRACCLAASIAAAAAAAVIATGPPSQHTAQPAHQARVVIADGPICPAGTNWNNILQSCA